MRTDSLFYSLFQQMPETFFEVIGKNAGDAERYHFSAEEVKQKSFRIDGVFKPAHADLQTPLYFVEVQFWNNPDLYWELFAEIFLYLNQEKPAGTWKAAVMFARKDLDPGLPMALEALRQDHLLVIYLDELVRQNTANSIGIGMIKLILEPPASAAEEARKLLVQTKSMTDQALTTEKTLEAIETIMVYKFPGLSRKEIETMFELADLRETRVFQEALEEGEAKGKLSAVPVLLRLGLSAEDAARELGLPVRVVRKMAKEQTASVPPTPRKSAAAKDRRSTGQD